MCAYVCLPLQDEGGGADIWGERFGAQLVTLRCAAASAGGARQSPSATLRRNGFVYVGAPVALALVFTLFLCGVGQICSGKSNFARDRCKIAARTFIVAFGSMRMRQANKGEGGCGCGRGGGGKLHTCHGWIGGRRDAGTLLMKPSGS